MSTSKEKRVCLHCGKDIGNVHKLRKFCQNTLDAHGCVNSCKDDFHNAAKRPRYEKTKRITDIHFKNYEILHRLFQQKKIVISAADLEKAGFKIHFYVVKAKIPGREEYGLYYIDYLLQGKDYKQLTIERHDHKF